MKNTLKRLWKDESAQGMTEYILILVGVVAIGLIFKDKIRDMVNGKLDEVQSGLNGITTN